MASFVPVRQCLAAAACALLLAPAPAPQAVPSDPIELLGLIGKPATGLTFAPLDGPMQPLARAGKPTVVIAFASWCTGCIQEMPRNLADYEKYKDRVAFLGIDYTESPAVARKTIAQYDITFPVESFDTGSAFGAAPQTGQARTLTIPNDLTRPQILALEKMLPRDLFDRVLTVYDARAHMTPDQFADLEKQMGVFFEDPAKIAAEASSARSDGKSLDLPHAFVIDANGVVVKAIDGYNPSIDEIALELLNLGIK